MDDGYEVSVDYLGELSNSTEDATRAAKQYVEISNFYKDVNIDMSIKPTQLGALVDGAYCEKLLFEIVSKAYENGHTVRLDMEDREVTSLTINHCLRIKQRHPNIGIAVQANLRRTKADITQLINHNVSMRLVKGAYRGDLVNATVSARFSSLAYHLKSRKANSPAIATHDEKLISKINNKFYDYEFLYGVRRDLQKNLLNRGYRVRIYIPFGTEWLPYTLRRLKEWKNLKFVLINIFREWRACLAKKTRGD